MRVDLLYPDECAAIEKALRGQFQVIWIVGVSSGLRISDILRLRARDFRKDRVYVKEQKTGKLRRVYLRKRVRKAVLQFVESKGIGDNDRVFNVSRQAVWDSFKRAGRRAALRKNIGTHSMRKTYSLGHIRKGYDITDLQRRLNHSKLSDTVGYITSNDALGLNERGQRRSRKSSTRKGKK